MREILFRAKAINRDKGYHRTNYKNGDWVYGLITRLYDNQFPNLPAEMSVMGVSGIEVDYESIGQYTGLTDKNGKRIFEGDIVLFEDESPSSYEYHDCTEMRCGAIEYGDNCFYITDRIAVEMEDLIYDGKLDVEVIGNIHDNPELVKGGVE